MTNAPSVDATAFLRWVELALPEPPWSGGAPFVGFVYLDPQAGLSAKGGPADDAALADAPRLTVRLPIGVPGRVLPDGERATRGLPPAPSWLDRFGAQPQADPPWRRDPALAGRFHRSWPDDLQVLVHDGEPRRTGRRTEVCWVRVDAAADAPPRPSQTADGTPLPRATTRYAGTLLSVPKQLATWKAGARVDFLPDAGGRHPVAVTVAYLDERAAWIVRACDGCGLTEGLDPPSVMFRTRFPDADADADAAPVAFTAHCPVCGPPAALAFSRA